MAGRSRYLVHPMLVPSTRGHSTHRGSSLRARIEESMLFQHCADRVHKDGGRDQSVSRPADRLTVCRRLGFLSILTQVSVCRLLVIYFWHWVASEREPGGSLVGRQWAMLIAVWKRTLACHLLHTSHPGWRDEMMFIWVSTDLFVTRLDLIQSFKVVSNIVRPV